MRYILNHTVNTHHITSLIFLNNRTGNIEQNKLNHRMTVHMQHHSLQGKSGKDADTGNHNADVFHRGIRQNTLNVALYNNERHGNRHSQHSKEQQHAAHHRSACCRQQDNQITQQYINSTAAERTAQHTAGQ
ncbi:unknown [Phascolarctobacterium succinatutens CAG:287]|uniref:Uncharacterized protein n=1 Tax=Phascolarctobacterium succinatutens CAG:287 TaxID=1263101 RepID=R6WT58_9FIRM|nr:unknown [Phascolarctobacterium succinatutens CAG:287]